MRSPRRTVSRGDPLKPSEWKVQYSAILADFGYDPARDVESARVLDAKLPDSGFALKALRRIRGKSVAVLGGARESGERMDTLRAHGVVIAADSAVKVLVDIGHVPLAVVTDLDGSSSDLEVCADAGSVMVIHAHGDNIHKMVGLEALGDLTLGTCQCDPFGRLYNFGGFTDGDRACLTAEHFGATSIELYGFDFESPEPKAGRDPAVKLRKLQWAKKLIKMVRIPVYRKGERIV